MSSYAAAALTLGLMAQFAPLAPTSAPMLGDGRTTAGPEAIRVAGRQPLWRFDSNRSLQLPSS